MLVWERWCFPRNKGTDPHDKFDLNRWCRYPNAKLYGYKKLHKGYWKVYKNVLTKRLEILFRNSQKSLIKP